MVFIRSLTVFAIAALLLAPVARAEEEEAPDPNELAEDYAKEFKKAYKDMSEADLIAGVDKLVAFYNDPAVDDDGAKDDLLEGLQTAALRVKSNVVVIHVLKKAQEIKNEDILKVILPTLKRELSQKTPDIQVYEAALATLGALHFENKLAINELTDLLKHKDDVVVSAAIRAISGYGEASGNVRKDLFEEVLKISEGVYSGAQASNPNLERKWNVISADVKDALTRLSGVKMDNPVAARSWFNDNKKKNWDRREGG